MSRYCNNEDEHRQDAKRDFNYNGSYGYDRECYDKYSSDPCKQVYTEEFDKLRNEERRQEEYREEQRQQEENELRNQRCRENEEMWNEYYSQMEQIGQRQPKQQQYPPIDDMPF